MKLQSLPRSALLAVSVTLLSSSASAESLLPLDAPAIGVPILDASNLVDGISLPSAMLSSMAPEEVPKAEEKELDWCKAIDNYNVTLSCEDDVRGLVEPFLVCNLNLLCTDNKLSLVPNQLREGEVGCKWAQMSQMKCQEITQETKIDGNTYRPADPPSKKIVCTPSEKAGGEAVVMTIPGSWNYYPPADAFKQRVAGVRCKFTGGWR